MPRTKLTLLVAPFLVFALVTAPAHAGTDPADACKATKAKAAGKKAADLLKAFGKNCKTPDVAKLGASVSKAQSKLTKQYSKAEAKGGCLTTGDVSAAEGKVDALVLDIVAEVNPPDTTTTTISSTTTTTLAPGVVLQGALTPTVGRFNYNLTLGLPGADAACNTNFPGTHACTYAELQTAEAAGDLVGLTDIAANTVTSFWAIDGAQPPLQQCQDDVVSFQNWEYATAHTASRGQRVSLNNGTGALGSLQSGVQCNIAGTSWVGCCL